MLLVARCRPASGCLPGMVALCNSPLMRPSLGDCAGSGPGVRSAVGLGRGDANSSTGSEDPGIRLGTSEGERAWSRRMDDISREEVLARRAQAARRRLSIVKVGQG